MRTWAITIDSSGPAALATATPATTNVRAIVVQNLNLAQPVYLGGVDVTTSNGLRLAPGEHITVPLAEGDTLCAIAPLAQTCDTRVLATADIVPPA